MTANLTEIQTKLLDDHPKNPRLSFRQEVIDGIAANLNGHFPQQYAMHVRPVGERFEIIAGHHRRRAAEQRGLKKVWAWVEELTDEAAEMALVTSNNQGELSPLEIGLHALRCVGKAKAGRGKKGGLAEYAEKIGKSKQYISQLVAAAEVVETLKSSSQLDDFSTRTQHLCAIHALPESFWPEMAQACLKWSVDETEAGVKRAFDYMKNAPQTDLKDYLPRMQCALAVGLGVRTAQDFLRLEILAKRVTETVKDHPDLVHAWCEFLVGGVGGSSWDTSNVQAKRVEIEAEADRRNTLPNQPKDAPATVIIADPPWRYDFAETDNRQIENQYPTADVDEICTWTPKNIADDCVLLLWATAPKLIEALTVLQAWGFEYKTCAVWDKEKIGMGYWFRGQHELLLVGTRGKAQPPNESQRVSSIFRETRGRHSAKPECFYSWVRLAFAGAVIQEEFQRTQRQGIRPGRGNEA
jgi:ParB/RepB/Spo0J family partition protein